jgi:hypothetical protein
VWSYPEALHGRALTRLAVVRHAISVLLDDLEGSTTFEAQDLEASLAAAWSSHGRLPRWTGSRLR